MDGTPEPTGDELVPEWDALGIPEDDDAEPDDAGTDHYGDI